MYQSSSDVWSRFGPELGRHLGEMSLLTPIYIQPTVGPNIPHIGADQIIMVFLNNAPEFIQRLAHVWAGVGPAVGLILAANIGCQSLPNEGAL